MKNWYQSKTMWFNIISAVLVVLEAQLGVLTPLLPSDVAPWVLLGIPLINVVLRVITTQPLAIGNK
jgi:hypothetical protein